MAVEENKQVEVPFPDNGADPAGETLAQDLADANEDHLNSEQLAHLKNIVQEYRGQIKCHLNRQEERRARWSDRVADKMAAFGGSWSFLLLFILFLVVWITINSIPGLLQVDAYPFILLNLLLSTISAIQAPVILMSQNRHAERERQEAILSFAINYKAEQENREMHEILERIERHLEKLTR